jgi:hypothetical protein
MQLLSRLYRYFEHLWIGRDGKPSLRAVLAIAFSIDFIMNTSYAIRKWEIGKSYADVAMLLGIEAGLIAALLGLRMYQAIQEAKAGLDKINVNNEGD